MPRSQKDPRSRIRLIQDLGSRWILDPADQVLSRDPGDLGSPGSLDSGSLDPGDLGSSSSDFARDPMDLGSCFLIFFRGILSIFTDFITYMTYFCAKFKGFRSRLHFAWYTGSLDPSILILRGVQRDLGS